MWFKLTSFAVIIVIFGFASTADAKRIVCYYGSSSIYRPYKGKFQIEDIDPNLCTHLIYSFVGITNEGSIKILDSSNDIDNGGFTRFNRLRVCNPSLKTLVAVGGPNVGSTVFSVVARSQCLRTAFVRSAVQFVQTHGFNGMDLDWEFPAQKGGISADKVNFCLLVKELRVAFDRQGYLLTAAVGATANAIHTSYHDVPTMSKNLDFINIMAYDLHGYWDHHSGENAPLYLSSEDVTPASKQLNVAACIQAWINNGAAPDKLVFGIATYGQSFTLTNASNHGIGALTSSPGAPGPYTKQIGFLGYMEICEMQQSGRWTAVWDNEQKVPYAYSGNQWVGYDNLVSVAYKVNYADHLRLGGVMVSGIENDDFRGVCGQKYPLLSTINLNMILNLFGCVSW